MKDPTAQRFANYAMKILYLINERLPFIASNSAIQELAKSRKQYNAAEWFKAIIDAIITNHANNEKTEKYTIAASEIDKACEYTPKEYENIRYILHQVIPSEYMYHHQSIIHSLCTKLILIVKSGRTCDLAVRQTKYLTDLVEEIMNNPACTKDLNKTAIGFSGSNQDLSEVERVQASIVYLCYLYKHNRERYTEIVNNWVERYPIWETMLKSSADKPDEPSILEDAFKQIDEADIDRVWTTYYEKAVEIKETELFPVSEKFAKNQPFTPYFRVKNEKPDKPCTEGVGIMDPNDDPTLVALKQITCVLQGSLLNGTIVAAINYIDNTPIRDHNRNVYVEYSRPEIEFDKIRQSMRNAQQSMCKSIIDHMSQLTKNMSTFRPSETDHPITVDAINSWMREQADEQGFQYEDNDTVAFLNHIHGPDSPKVFKNHVVIDQKSCESAFRTLQTDPSYGIMLISPLIISVVDNLSYKLKALASVPSKNEKQSCIAKMSTQRGRKSNASNKSDTADATDETQSADSKRKHRVRKITISPKNMQIQTDQM
jgi:hypothetical protein